MKTRLVGLCLVVGLMTLGCGNIDSDTERIVEQLPVSRTGDLADQVLLSQPQPGTRVSSPLSITGKAPGNWFFEATAPVVLVDWDGRILAQHYIQAEGEWMTVDLVPFAGTIEFEVPEDIYRRNGALILQRHNAAGLPQYDGAVEVPVIFE